MAHAGGLKVTFKLGGAVKREGGRVEGNGEGPEPAAKRKRVEPKREVLVNEGGWEGEDGDLEAYAEAHEYGCSGATCGALCDEEEDERGRYADGEETLKLAPTEGLTPAVGREHRQYRFSDFEKEVGGTGALKPDHSIRPLFVCPDGVLFVENVSERAAPELGRELRQMLATAAEPTTRPELVEEWRLTPFSLHAAVSVGWKPSTIIASLTRLSKCAPLPASVVRFIEEATRNYGKAKLVLRDNEYWVETKSRDVMQMLLADEVVRSCISRADKNHVSHMWMRKLIGMEGGADEIETGPVTREMKVTVLPWNEQANRRYCFVVRGADVERVKERCLPSGLDLPLLEEFDYSGAAAAARRRLLASQAKECDIDMDANDDNCGDSGEDIVASFYLRQTTKLREYQKTAISKIFAHGAARSGIVVLPCGAGKSLCGVAIAERLKRSTLVLCISAVSVDQWVSQFRLWTTLPNGAVARCTADYKESWADGVHSGVLVTTYNMVAYNEDRRSAASRDFLRFLSSHEWGTLILDEVHVVPAEMFRKVVGIVRAHLKVGLTATLVREDDKVGDLHFLIGPKLYEASWIELRDNGFIARVCCYELRCPMDTGGFLDEYMKRTDPDTSDVGGGAAGRSGMGGMPFLLAAGNPYKLRTLEFLINFHTKRHFVDGYFKEHPEDACRLPKTVLDGTGFVEEGVTDPLLQHFPVYPDGPVSLESIRNVPRGDRVLVFSDSVYLLQEFARALKYPYIHGEMGHADREFWLQAFRDGMYWRSSSGALVTEEPVRNGQLLRGKELLHYHRSMGNQPVACNVLFLSKVGDVGLDLPEANVVIQVSSHGGSRRQEAQRLGRILRPKNMGTNSSKGGLSGAAAMEFEGKPVEIRGQCALNPLTTFGTEGAALRSAQILGDWSTNPSAAPPPRPDAFFYTLVSGDTHEVLHASRRRRFLVEQGYTYKVIRDVLKQHPLACSSAPFSNISPKHLASEEEASAYREKLSAHVAALRASAAAGSDGAQSLMEARAALWSGAGGFGRDLQSDTAAAKAKAGSQPRHALFRERQRELKRRG